jgi:probable phosphoglycerate mutase
MTTTLYLLRHGTTEWLTRCRQTAEQVARATGLQAFGTDDLQELDFGWLEKKRFPDVYRLKYAWLVRFLNQYPRRLIRALSGEPISVFRQRVQRAWDQILAENPQGAAIIVGHSAVFNEILIHYFGRNFPPGEGYYRMGPGSITQLKVHPDGAAELVRLNDLTHLPEDLR